jgi:integrase
MTYAYAPLKRVLGPLYADSITQTTVDNYARTRLSEPVARKGGRYSDRPVGEATVNKELRMLRAALNWAGSERLIGHTPTFRIELSAGDSRDVWITKESANRLIAAASPHIALFILIALSTAKRREAILSLTWNRVSLHMQGYETIDFGDDVGNKRRGKTPISGMTRLIAALKAAKAVAQTDYVIEFRGKPVGTGIKTALAAACRRAGIEHISAHVLKHTAVTWMIQGGMTFEEVSKFTNTSKDIIQRVYGHHSPEFVAGAARALAF